MNRAQRRSHMHAHCPECGRCVDEGEAFANIPDASEPWGVKPVCVDCAREYAS